MQNNVETQRKHPLHTLSFISLVTSYKGQSLNIMVHVVETNSSLILGMRACKDHSLIQLVYSRDVGLHSVK